MYGKVHIQPHIRSMIDPDGAVLLDLQEGKYYSLNGIAAEIWKKIETGTSLQNILADLEARFDTTIEKLSSDLEVFIGSLERKGLIDVNC